MRSLFACVLGAALVVAAPAMSGSPDAARGAHIVFLGEVHDNPAHHARQADWVRALAPKAIVFEMLPEALDEAAIAAARGDAQALAGVLGWADLGWPDFEMYHPIFTAAPGAAIRGALIGRAEARAAMTLPLAQAFGEGAEEFGLDLPLPPEMQDAREALQMKAHCDALPESMLPGMVAIQRLRDAALARAARDALRDLGPPVVVITGNGHARTDWGAPALLPGLSVFALGQSEGGVGPEGTFDLVLDAEPIDRPDPCLAFR